MKIRILLTCSLLLSWVGNVYAAAYDLPTMQGDRVVAQYPNEDSHLIPIQQEDYPELQHITLLDVAKRYNLGQEEIVRLNPTVDRWLVKTGEMVRIPNKRILPDTPHNGITLNISEFRMYYYPANTGKVYSFAHGIGRQDWKTPLGRTKIIRKIKNPTWNPPASIRREHAAEGDILPAVVPPGPHNPLGTRALYLGLPGEYRIHGTDIDKVYGIGMQITHGCVRMYPEDIEELYDIVGVGTPVYIVKQPIKVGWLNNVLYLEAHPDLEGENMGKERRYQVALELIRKHNSGELPEFDQKALNDALEKLDGEPVALYERLGPPPAGAEVEPTLPPTITPEPLEQQPATPIEPTSKVKTDNKVAVVKPVSKTDTKVAVVKPVVKTGTKVAVTKPAVKTDTKIVAKPVAKTDVKVAAKSATKPTTKPTAKTDVKIAAKSVSNTKVVAKPVTKTDTVKPAKTAKSDKTAPRTAAKSLPKPLA
ncbi:L,D-transpeptidase ErfK/SrfK [Patescibacteria group bacterium]|nr:L,D-transpeptidase ErfK/SrfK [Patescibacteria group bacterium]